jgi:hypothetical protein
MSLSEPRLTSRLCLHGAILSQQTANRCTMPRRLRKGDKVKIQGLQGAKHLNGEEGKLNGFMSQGGHVGRWAVRLRKDGNTVAVKPANLEYLPKYTEEETGSLRTSDRSQPANNSVQHLRGLDFDTLMGMVQSGQLNLDKVAPKKSRSSWSDGLSTEDQYEWLSNCYQMRCDDDYAYGGCKCIPFSAVA